MRIIFTIILYLTLPALLFAEQGADTLQAISLQAVEVVSSPKESGQLNRQPMASTSIGNLREHHISALKGASTIVPNLFIPDYGSRLTSAVYIRGVGSRTGTPAVAMYVDNVPYSDKSAFDFNFHDIERIDVLRGPQATLYGRNAMGGIIKVHTKNPFRYQGTDAHLSYNTGNDHRLASVTHYHLVNDKVAFSGGAYAEGATGFYRNATTATDVDHMRSAGGRMRGILLPNNQLRIDLSASYDYSREGGYPYFYLGAADGHKEEHPELIGLISNNRESSYRRSLLNVGGNLEYRGEGWTLNAITGYQHLRDRMFLDQDFLRPDIYTLTQRQRLHNASEEILFRSTHPGKWQWMFGASLMGQTLHTSGPVTFYADGLRWLERNINANMPSMERIPMMQMMGFTGMGVNFRGSNLVMDGTYSTPTLSAALFHQSTVKLAEDLTLTAGLRLDYENQRMRYNSPAHVDYGFTMPNRNNPKMAVDLQDLQLDVLYRGTLRRNYLHLLPKLALQYDFSADNNIYASIAVGQRSGGYNLQMFSDLLQGAMRSQMMSGVQNGVGNYLDYLVQSNPNIPHYIPVDGVPTYLPDFVREMMAQNMPQTEVPTTEQVVYKPEHAWNYEVGTHLQPCKQLSLDAALFLSTIYDQQIARFADSGLGRMMVNAGKSLSWGGELSLRYLPNRHLTFTANYGYTHNTFLRYDAGEGVDYSDNYVPFVPRHTLYAEGMYTFYFPSSKVQSLGLGVNTNGYGCIYWTEDNALHQPFNAQLGGRMLLTMPWGSLSVWARNLTNNRYNTFCFVSANRKYAQYGAPRHVGVDIMMKF